MVTVTESAKDLLKEILTAHTDDPEMGLRLVLNQQEQLGLELGVDQSGDHQVVEHQGSKVLLVPPELAPSLEEVTVDVQDTDSGPNLILHKGTAE